jgi:hypothetical protein
MVIVRNLYLASSLAAIAKEPLDLGKTFCWKMCCKYYCKLHTHFLRSAIKNVAAMRKSQFISNKYKVGGIYKSI